MAATRRHFFRTKKPELGRIRHGSGPLLRYNVKRSRNWWSQKKWFYWLYSWFWEKR